MKTKIIPFDLEMAKKIQAGEIEGRIMYNGKNGGEEVIILSYNSKKYQYYPIRFAYVNYDEIDYLFDTSSLYIELPEETPEEQHPIEESELYQAGYKVGFEAGRCVAFDEKKGCVIKKEALKYDDVEEVPTGDGSIVFLRHIKHEFKPFDRVLVRDSDKNEWRPRLYSCKGSIGYCTQDGYEYLQLLPYEGNEHLVGTTDKP